MLPDRESMLRFCALAESAGHSAAMVRWHAEDAYGDMDCLPQRWAGLLADLRDIVDAVAKLEVTT